MLKKTATFLLILILVALMAAACSRTDQKDQRTASSRAETHFQSTPQTATQPSRQSTTIVQPPATFTPVPTATLPPTPTPAPLPPTPLVLAGQFGADRNQLTGELAADPALLKRRPIAVKISNAPARWTRPQSGLGQADLVFEHLTEGSITRFTAIFYGKTPEAIGPIRSARLIDLELPAMYDAALAFSGSSIGVSRKLFDSDFRQRILRTNTPGYYRTGENKPYEHTLYASPEGLWESLTARDENREPQFGSSTAFGQLAPGGGQAASSLTVRYYKFTTIDWRYDPSTGRYLRWTDGEPHLDANTGDQISAANVVVLVVPHQLDRTICEYQNGDRCLAYSMEIHLWGQGRALTLRDGQAYDATWNRPSRPDLLTFLDVNGRPFPLQIGNTWFQVVPTDYPDAYSINPPG